MWKRSAKQNSSRGRQMDSNAGRIKRKQTSSAKESRNTRKRNWRRRRRSDTKRRSEDTPRRRQLRRQGICL
jgi:hypothetical protein